MITTKFTKLSLAMALILSMPLQGYAQQAASDTSDQDDNETASAATEDKKTGFALERIEVTARKVKESIQDAPISITAFTGDSLEQRGIVGTTDLDQVTPNLQFNNNAVLAGNNSSSQIFIRGIGQLDPTATVDPGVGLYIDDVYMGQSLGGSMEFRDIDRVQVLRGPQGTLFGRNTIGGAVLLSTNEPGFDLGGSVRVGIGSDNLREAFVAVDLPMTENLLSRFTFGKKTQDGYVKRLFDGVDLGDTNTYTFTGKIVYDPMEKLKLKLQFDYTEADENGSPLVFAAINENAAFAARQSVIAGCPGATFPPPFIPQAEDVNNDLRCANDVWNSGPYSNNGTYELESTLKNLGMAFIAEYEFTDNINLKSITSHRELDWTGKRDADNTPFTILHTDYISSGKQFSQEFQLIYTGESFTGVAGLYYFDEKIDDIVTVALGIRDSLDSDNNITANDNWAAFTQWTYKVNDALSMTLGARYTEDTKGSTPDQFDYADPSAKYLPVKLYETTFDSFTTSLSVNYRWNEQVMTYVSYSEGFKGGGWNSHFNVPQNDPEILAALHSFNEENAKSYEFGFKLDLLDDSLRLNGAIFDTAYDDLQFVYRVGVAPFLANAGKASLSGGELELTWVPSDEWIIQGGLGYLNDSLDEVAEIPGTSTGVDTSKTLPYTPEWQWNLGIGYIASIAKGISILPRLDTSYMSEQFFDTSNTVDIAQNDSVTLVNASVAVEADDKQWRVSLAISNLTDELYPVAGNSSLSTGSGYAEIAYARGKEYHLSVNYRF
jgi:iron complex outermembrane receptor protein